MSLSSLVVHLKSNYGDLKSGLKTSGGLVASFAAKAKGSLGSVAGSLVKLGGAGLAVAGLGSVGTAVAGVTTQLDRLDKVAKLSSSTGFATESIMGLGFAAEQNGGSVEGLQKSMQKFSVVMGQAAAGTGPGVAGLKQLGLTFGALSGMSPDEQLLAVSEAMKQLPNEAQRNAVAMQLFGREGVNLTNMLAQGREGLGAFINEAKGLGLGFRKDELAQVEAANDSINRLKRGMGAFFGRLAVMASPLVSFVADSVLPMMNNTVGAITSGFEFVGGKVSSTFNALTPLVNQWFRGFWAQWEALKQIAGPAIDWISEKLSAFSLGSMQAWMTWFATVEFGWQNWQQIAALAVVGVQLSVVRFGEEVVHTITQRIPGTLTWLAKNWRDIFFSMFDYTTTVFINLGTNIRSAMSAIWEFIKSGGTSGFQMNWTPLTEGFRSTLSELPNIPPRMMGPLESSLQAELDNLKKQTGDGLSEHLAARLKELDDFKAKSEEAKKNQAHHVATGPNTTGTDDPSNMTKTVEVKVVGANTTGTDDPSNMTKTVEVKVVGAMMAGTAEAFSAIQKSIAQNREATRAERMQQQQAAAMAEQNRLAAEQVRLQGETLDFLKSNPPDVLDDLT